MKAMSHDKKTRGYVQPVANASLTFSLCLTVRNLFVMFPHNSPSVQVVAGTNQ